MGRFVSGTEWKVMQAEEAIREDMRQHRRAQRRAGHARPIVDKHDIGGLILFGILLSPIVFGILKWMLGM